MKSSATIDGKQYTSKGVFEKQPVALLVPMRELECVGESIALGFRSEMLSMGDGGEVLTGSGLGTDFIILKWGDRQTVLRGSELLRAWVKTFAPKEASRFPEEIAELVEANVAPGLLDLLKAAVARVELENAEGNSILSAWIQDAREAITKAEGGKS